MKIRVQHDYRVSQNIYSVLGLDYLYAQILRGNGKFAYGSELPGCVAKYFEANVSVILAICCDSPGSRNASRRFRIASATGVYSKIQDNNRNARNGPTPLKSRRPKKCPKTSRFSGLERKSPSSFLSILGHIRKNFARLKAGGRPSAYISLFSSRKEIPSFGLALKRKAPVRMSCFCDLS
jgi:hypothetical protein